MGVSPTIYCDPSICCNRSRERDASFASVSGAASRRSVHSRPPVCSAFWDTLLLELAKSVTPSMWRPAFTL